MPTPFVADAADEAVRSESILNERKAADIIEETALEVDIRASGTRDSLVDFHTGGRHIAPVARHTIPARASASAVRDGRKGPDGADAIRGRYRPLPAVERAGGSRDARAALAVAVSAHLTDGL